jgi:capsular exopolysaccharide synthesis family protein
MSGKLVSTEPGDGLNRSPAPLGTEGALDLSGYEPPPAEPKGSMNIGRLRATVARFRWLILAITTLGTAGSVLATRFIKPLYNVDAIILIQQPNTRSGPIQADELLDNRNWVDLVTTFIVLDPVVQKEKLYLKTRHPEHRLALEGFDLADRFLPGSFEVTVDEAGRTWSLRRTGGLTVGSGAVGDSIGREIGFKWAPAAALLGRDRTIEFEVLTPREASNDLATRITPRYMNNGSFLRLTLNDTEAERAASTMNSLVSRFVDVAAALKRENLTKLRSTLQEQVAQAESGLKASEEELQSFRVRTITLPGETVIPSTPGLVATQTPAMGTFFQQKEELNATRRDRRAIESVLKRAQAGDLAVDAFQTIAAVQSAPDLKRVLNELSTTEAHLRDSLNRYTTEYPGVRRLNERIETIRTEVIPAYATALVDRLKEMESDLESRIAGASGELQSIPTRTMNEQRLQRDVDSRRRIFIDLQGRHEEAKLAELSAIPDVSVLDTAVAPTRPSKNTAARLILMGIAASIGLALALAFLLDRLDSRFRYPEQASDELGLTILGAIPEIRRTGRQNPEDVAQVVEAFRSIRLNLAHSYSANGAMVLTISSPGAGDGKSLVSTNLALSFAEAGYNTLLIDGDTRRGELHRMFSAERRPGLLDFLGGSSGTQQITRGTTHQKLTLIPCGSRKNSGPELLGSARMANLVAELKESYDVILIDSPPLGAGIDPFVLGTLAGNLMLVLRAGETDREMAESRLKIIDRLPIRLLGAVLNDVRASGGVYKYYSYLSGYAAEEETESEMEATPAVPSKTGG